MLKNNKKNKVIFYFHFPFLLILLTALFTINLFSIDINGKDKFKNFVNSFEKKIPQRFNCELKSKLFDDYINQLPDEAFLDRKHKPAKIVLYYEKGKTPLYTIENVYDDYKAFIKNYFSFLNDSLVFFVLSESKIKELLNNYEIKYTTSKNSNIFKVSKDEENKELIFFTDKGNKTLKGIDIYFNGQKYINLFFLFKKINIYIVPEQIKINLLDEKQQIIISFINYKIYK